MKNKRNKIFKDWGKAVVLALILALIFRAFIFQSYTATSNNMNKTLQKGDRIIVNKLSYGLRLPMTILSVPFFPNVYSTLISIPYHRVNALEKIKRNQILAINKPYQNNTPIDKRNTLTTRCIGIPGDTILINNQDVFVNSFKSYSNSSIMFRYRIINSATMESSSNKLGIIDTVLCIMGLQQAQDEKSVRFVSKLSEAPGINYLNYFPKDSTIRWNSDYFGPLVIPKKGLCIKLNANNYALYKNVINYHENISIELKENKLFINNKLDSIYTFKNDYYFTLNDNRSDVNDSRTWGLLPESHIIGKVQLSIQKRKTILLKRYYN